MTDQTQSSEEEMRKLIGAPVAVMVNNERMKGVSWTCIGPPQVTDGTCLFSEEQVIAAIASQAEQIKAAETRSRIDAANANSVVKQLAEAKETISALEERELALLAVIEQKDKQLQNCMNAFTRNDCINWDDVEKALALTPDLAATKDKP